MSRYSEQRKNTIDKKIGKEKMCRKHSFHGSFHRKSIITLGDDCEEALAFSKKQ